MKKILGMKKLGQNGENQGAPPVVVEGTLSIAHRLL